MKAVINPKYNHLQEFIGSIPGNFESTGTTFYSERNILKSFRVDELDLSVKSFRIPHFINKFAYGFIRPSKARRSYENGIKLVEKGINTPDPVAYIEIRRGGLLFESYYICRYQQFDGMMRELRTASFEDKKPLIEAFAGFTAMIHEKNVYHQDYSPGNILYNFAPDGYTFSIIDINRMTFRPIDMELGCKNLNRMWGSDEMVAYTARKYAEIRGFNPSACEKTALKYHRIFWEKFKKRYPDAQPYSGPDQ